MTMGISRGYGRTWKHRKTNDKAPWKTMGNSGFMKIHGKRRAKYGRRKARALKLRLLGRKTLLGLWKEREVAALYAMDERIFETIRKRYRAYCDYSTQKDSAHDRIIRFENGHIVDITPIKQ